MEGGWIECGGIVFKCLNLNNPTESSGCKIRRKHPGIRLRGGG